MSFSFLFFFILTHVVFPHDRKFLHVITHDAQGAALLQRFFNNLEFVV